MLNIYNYKITLKNEAMIKQSLMKLYSDNRKTTFGQSYICN